MEIMNLKINNLRKLEARLWPIVSFMSVKFVPKKKETEYEFTDTKIWDYHSYYYCLYYQGHG